MSTLQCQIISPQKTIIYKNLIKIKLPTYQGIMEVLPFHAETFVLLNSGEITLINENDKKKIVKIVSGECHIENNELVIIL